MSTTHAPAPRAAPSGPAQPATAIIAGEARWPAVVAVLAVGTLHMALPDPMNVGPPWLMLAVVGALLIPTIVAHRAERHDVNAWFGNAVQLVVSGSLVWSLWQLFQQLTAHAGRPEALLRAASAIWITNVLVFASWYWRIDAGGPNGRDRVRRGAASRAPHAFLFPQMTLGPTRANAWHPEFVDYLFLAFCVSTAFSPADTAVLERPAKLLVMGQALISLVAVAVVAARAVNIL